MKNTTLLAVSNDLDRIVHNFTAHTPETIRGVCEAMQRSLIVLDDYVEELEAELADIRHDDDPRSYPDDEPEGHVCEVCELDLVRRGDIVGMPHRQLHVTEGGTELCPECFALYLQGDDA